ncbi:RDD family protein [Streptomyces sp. NPDC017890]|uniref:RDD family protein n=1 Tax=Streptomyces sp. NPDC017890 TaxID=3365015 RepID=UPI00379B3170
MSAPTPAPGDDRPREGYYPDPSIPGYVRYWNGASWVPGTSRPAPKDGEPLAPPPGARHSVEETGPHFFDEDPVGEPPAASQHGSRPEPATAWGADRSHQSGFPGDPNQRVDWPGPAQGEDPRVPHARGAGPAGGAAAEPGPAAAGGIPGARTAGGVQDGHAPGGPAGAGTSTGTGAEAPGGARAGGGSVAEGSAGGGRTADAGSAGGGPAQGGDARSARADASPGAASAGEAEAGSGSTFVFRRPTAGAQGGPDGAAADEGTMTFRAVPPRTAAAGGPGFGAGKAAAARAAAAQAPSAAAPTALSGPQQKGGPTGQAGPTGPTVPTGPTGPTGSAVPHQAAVPQPAASPQQPAASAPIAPGPGGGQSSWAQQVHRLAGAGGDEQPVAPWKPPVEDVFQAAARRQAAARPAGLGKRLAARLIDTVVLGCVTAAAAVPLGVKGFDHVKDKIDEAKLSGETVTVWLLDGTTSTYLGIVLAVLLLSGVAYEALPTAKWGRTLGKKLLGLEVRDIEAHEPPAFGAALRRWLVYSVPGLLVVGVIGVVWCLFDRPWRQCWHDKAARTFVAG